MAERLSGAETEYALLVRDRRGQRMNVALAAEHVMRAAQSQWMHLPDLHSTGVFLTNGGRFYIDCGHHPELTTPECTNPWDVVRYLKAGEDRLASLSASLVADGLGEVSFFRQNVDYSGTGNTWGSHESYLHQTDPARFRQHLIPHLVSRLIYTGSGGFDSQYPGVRFVLSPRVPHLQVDVSHDSTHTRGILHTKDESLSAAGYHRLHLLCSESLFSERAMFLRYGATALVVALIEAGLQPGIAVQLQQPLRAMQAFARDPRCHDRMPDVEGWPLTALGIQRQYLALAERHQRAAFMPPWAETVCRLWRATLDQIAAGSPDAVATSLDWAIRHAVFTRFLQSRGQTWESLERWNAIAEHVGDLPDGPALADELEDFAGDATPDVILDQVLPELRPELRQHGVTVEAFRQFRALRAELFELDTRFGQLGSAGLFAQLDRAGVLQHHVPGVDNFEHALEHPPTIGRARLRGECVRRFGSSPETRTAHACDWAAVWDHTGNRFLDLSHPFCQEEQWKSLASDADARAMPSQLSRHRQLMELMASLQQARRTPDAMPSARSSG